MRRIKKKLYQIIFLIKNVSISAGLFEFFSALAGIDTAIGKKIAYYKHEAVKSFLKRKYSSLIIKYQKLEDKTTIIDENSKIWIFWWQGIENMPTTVKACYESVKRQMPNRHVMVIDRNNYREYINIPESVLVGIDNGKISIAHLSDYIRLSLLAKFGGIWLDSTLFLSGDISIQMRGKKFYTLHHNHDCSTHVCKGKWFVSLLAVGEHSKLFRFAQEMMETVLVEYNYVFTYLLMDCIIAVAYESLSDVRGEIDAVEVNNADYIYLDHHMKDNYSADIKLFLNQQIVHKLSYKTDYNFIVLPETSNYHQVLTKGVNFG